MPTLLDFTLDAGAIIMIIIIDHIFSKKHQIKNLKIVKTFSTILNLYLPFPLLHFLL